MREHLPRPSMRELVTAVAQLLVVRQTLLTEPAHHRTAAQLAMLERQLTERLAQLAAQRGPSGPPLELDDLEDEAA